MNRTTIDCIRYAQNLAMISAVLTFAGCHSKAEEKSAKSTEAPVTASEKPAGQKTIEGTVTAITAGKDGFTASIETAGSGDYQALISRANLLDGKQYRELNQGEIVKLQGEVWEMDGAQQLTVREIL